MVKAFNLIQSSRTDIHMLYSMATSFFEQSDTHHPTLMFDDLWNADFVLVATCVGCCQLSRLEISPYQEALLGRGVCHRHRGQALDGQMEQAMGYTGAVGMMLMNKMAGIFERAEERFTVRATFTLALSSAGCNRLGPTAEGTCSPLPDNQQGAILW